MRIVTGYKSACSYLNRTIAGADYPVGPELKKRLQDMFGVSTAEEAVALIIADVKNNGDAALFRLTRDIDGPALSSIEISREQLEESLRFVDAETLEALRTAAERIRVFHEAQRMAIPRRVEANNCYQISQPLEKAGVYAPGGTACYPSSVLMTVIPARCAGVGEVILATPPGRDGKIPALTLAAAALAKVDRVFSIGGAQAIAALAYGTESVPRVDKICGPGNVFVALAKRQVFGMVDIDGLQGPSEVIIVADESALPANIINEILAQAEHDVMAQSILITTSAGLAREVDEGLAETAARLNRAEIASRSIQSAGLIIVIETLGEAARLTNMYAPEHLVLDISCPEQDYSRFYNAGCIFTGEYPTVVMGDYVSGPSHALPTGGTARFSSPLNVASFVRYYNVVDVDREMLRDLGPVAAKLARAEGLTAHAEAVEGRLQSAGEK